MILIQPVGADFHITQPYGPTSFAAEPPRFVDGVLVPHFHSGVDYANGKCGDPVMAAADGVVSTSLTQSGGNNLVILAHGQGYTTAYGHLSVRLVAQGDRVTAGETIGRIGNTGNSTGCHLHFIAALNQQDFDPLTLMGGDMQAPITDETPATADIAQDTPILDLDGVTPLTATGGLWAGSSGRYSPYRVGTLGAFVISYPKAGERRLVLMECSNVKPYCATPGDPGNAHDAGYAEAKAAAEAAVAGI